MIKKISLLFIYIHMSMIASIHSVDTKKALTVVCNAQHEAVIFVNIDIHKLDDIYQKSYEEIEKKAKTLCKYKKKEGYEILSFINASMSTIDPLYISSSRLSPSVIGTTRRPLRWSHVIRRACYNQGIKKPTERFLYAIEKEHPLFEDDYEFVEYNTGILYLYKADTGKAISSYLTNHQKKYRAVIYIDTDKNQVESCINSLQKLHPNLKLFGLHVTN